MLLPTLTLALDSTLLTFETQTFPAAEGILLVVLLTHRLNIQIRLLQIAMYVNYLMWLIGLTEKLLMKLSSNGTDRVSFYNWPILV